MSEEEKKDQIEARADESGASTGRRVKLSIEQIREHETPFSLLHKDAIEALANLPGAVVRVYVALLGLAQNKTGRVFATYKTITDRSEVKQVGISLDTLEQEALIRTWEYRTNVSGKWKTFRNIEMLHLAYVRFSREQYKETDAYAQNLARIEERKLKHSKHISQEKPELTQEKPRLTPTKSGDNTKTNITTKTDKKITKRRVTRAKRALPPSSRNFITAEEWNKKYYLPLIEKMDHFLELFARQYWSRDDYPEDTPAEERGRAKLAGRLLHIYDPKGKISMEELAERMFILMDQDQWFKREAYGRQKYSKNFAFLLNQLHERPLALYSWIDEIDPYYFKNHSVPSIGPLPERCEKKCFGHYRPWCLDLEEMADRTCQARKECRAVFNKLTKKK